MKKLFFKLTLFLLCLSVNSAYAQIIQSVKLINHTDAPLDFVITHHPEIVPDFPEEFSLTPGETLVSSVKEGSQAYLSANQEELNAFFGVESQAIHGYIAIGIAFSWKTLNKQAHITFCAPTVYDEKTGCP